MAVTHIYTGWCAEHLEHRVQLVLQGSQGQRWVGQFLDGMDGQRNKKKTAQGLVQIEIAQHADCPQHNSSHRKYLRKYGINP